MKKYVLFLGVFMLLLSVHAEEIPFPLDQHPVMDNYDGWRLGIQIYSFKEYTFYEGLDKTAALGITWVEAYPGQILSNENPELKFNHNLPTEYREQVKIHIKSRGLKLVNYGVVGLPNDESQCRIVFDFAKDMGIETIVSEPPDEAWDLIDRLCQEYGINVAIHNHADPSHYWNPDKVLEVSEGRSKYIGACADIGHWMRSGIQPLEAIKKLEGRVISLHFGDLNEFGKKEAHDVPWGTGVADLESIMQELHRQGFQGVFSVEYEYNWKGSVPEIQESIIFFNKAAAAIQTPLWRALLNDNLNNWIFEPGSWEVSDGVLSAKGGGEIWSKDLFGDFVLDLDFKLADDTNSGVFLRTGSIKEWLHTAIEVQILDSHGNDPVTKHDCGAIFDCLEPMKNMVREVGEWNKYTIVCKANKINIILNGERVIDMDLNNWREAHLNPDGTPNKFNTAYKDMPRKGHLGLQYHGQPVWFRNIRIREISD
jgi:sugar phosphate isomerase/epimerase